MKTILTGVVVAVIGSFMLPSFAAAQDPLDRDSWNVQSGDWGNDDNWVDDLGELSGVPTTDGDRWALVGGGTATVSDAYSTAGLTIASGGTVDIVSGGSLQVALPDFANSVGQTDVAAGGTLNVASGASFSGLDGTLAGDVNLSQGGTLEFSSDVTITGNIHLEVNSSGTASIQAGGTATVGGSWVPTFSGVAPTFGESYTFVQADSITLANPNVAFPSLQRGLQADFVVADGAASIEITNHPILQVDRKTAAAKIMNVVGGPIEITGYAVESELGLLDTAGFSGFGGSTWDRPNPLNTVVSEFSLTNTQTINVGDTLDIGTIYNPGQTAPTDEDVNFVYFTPDGEIVQGLVDYVGPANDLVLNVNPESGEVTIRHESAFVDPIEVTGYSVISRSNSLKVAEWSSMEDGGQTGWLVANPDSDYISEVNPTASTVFSNGTVVSLGNIFDVEKGVRDLVLQYTTASEFLEATVEYQVLGGGSTGPTFLDADFDQNGVVEFADFLFLSSEFGNSVSPPGSPPDIDGDGTVNFADFLVLSQQFGQRSGAAAAVPEPQSFCLLAMGGMLVLASRRRRVGG